MYGFSSFYPKKKLGNQKYTFDFHDSVSYTFILFLSLEKVRKKWIRQTASFHDELIDALMGGLLMRHGSLGMQNILDHTASTCTNFLTIQINEK